MTAEADTATEVVEQLIISCRKTHEGFRCAAEAVKDDNLKRLLSIYAQQRTRFAEELREHLPPGSGFQWNHTASDVPWAEMEAQEVVRQCLDAETRSLDLYSQALASGEMPTKAHFLVSAQYSLLQRVHDRVQEMLATQRANERVLA